jgi:hypothetical protein
MSQPKKQGWLASMPPYARTTLGIFIIAVIVVLGVIYGPHYDDDETTTGDSIPVTPTVTNLLGTINVNRSIEYQNVSITVTNVAQAKGFSDDVKGAEGKPQDYIVRVMLQVQAPNAQKTAIGINFGNLTQLSLANGTLIPCSLAQISPDIPPGLEEDGYIDFFVSAPVSLSSLTFLLGSNAIAFK